LLSEQLVDKNTIENLVTVFRNECAILKQDKDSGFFSGGSNGDGGNAKSDKSDQQKQEKQKPKPKFTAYKYSKKGKLSLHEAVILAGRPVFLTIIDGKGNNDIQSYDIIEEDIRIIEPPHVENYPYEPYEFENMDDVLKYRDRALNENIDSLYLQAKNIAHNYNDQNKDKISLLAIEIIASYFQDRFPTTHYDIVLGGNGSGKSSYGDTFTAVGYRVVNLTDPNAANINRILGPIEIGQCTIVSYETGAIDKHPDLMSILKTGYSARGRTSKINDNTRDPEFFFTYCFKMIISERMPNLRDAKGVLDRSFSFTTYKGLPKYDIKETLEPQGNQARQERLNALNDFRKLMLIYRLVHFKDPISDIDVSVEGREKELCKPIIQLFYNTKAQAEVETTLQNFLNLRTEKKEITLEPILHPIISNLISKEGNEISVGLIWEELKDTIGGSADEKKPNEYHTLEYGTIYNNTIGNILEHTFGGRPKHRRFGNTFIFDPEELTRVGKAYNLTTKIQTKIIVDNNDTNVIEESQGISCEDCEDCEGIRKEPTIQNEGKGADNRDNSRGNGTADNEQIDQNIEGEPSVEPSHPSHASHKNLEESSNIIPESVYRAYADTWVCHNCNQKGDKWFMQKHLCKGAEK
jgi:hypothetical protein